MISAALRVSYLLRKTFIIVAACGVSALLLFGCLSLLFPLPPLKPYSLVVEDREGRFLHAFLAPDGAWRLRTSPGEIPERLKRMLILREDRWFYYHPGVNPLALARALVQNARAGARVSGASTITMQIARMLEPKERTYLHKAVEIFRAFQLEWRYSKSELLEIYLSMIPLGGNVEGLKSAAMIYYETPPERLNMARLFDLILIPGDPNGLQPDRNPARLLAERQRQAARWIRRGVLTPEDSLSLWTTPAAAVRHRLPSEAPHFALRIKDQFPGQAEVRTSLDLRIQKTVEALLSNHLRPWKLVGVRNGAVLVVRNSTREVVAYAGSEDFADAASHGQVDAVRALRSPGSTLKPFLYALAMDQGKLTPRTRLLDTPYDAEGFLAENYDGTYAGWVYADEALRRSLNVPMVRLLRSSGLGNFLDLAHAAGIASLQAQRSKLGLSMILGGCGVTLEEMTAAYATLANRGSYAPLLFRSAAGGRHAGDSGPAGEGMPVASSGQAFSAESAYMVTQILSGLDRPDLPNNFSSAQHLPRVAFKTGTSYGRRDAWSIGYTARFTVGVWIGNVTQEGNPGLVGSRSAAPLLIDILNSISTGGERDIMPAPADLGVRLVCAESGLPPNGRCLNMIDDYYSLTRTDDHRCTICAEYLVSPDGTRAYCPSCLGEHPYKAATYHDYPPELRNFWQACRSPRTEAPPHNPACLRVFAGDGPTIVSPSDNTTYFLVSARQKMTLEANAAFDVREHIWYLNDRYLGRSRAGARMLVHLNQGKHTVVCMDDKGRSTQVHVTVRYVL